MSFGRLRSGPKYIWTQVMTRNSCFTFHNQDPRWRNFVPLEHRGRRHAQTARKFARAAYAINRSLKCIRNGVHAYL